MKPGRILILSAAAILIAGSFFLPNAVAGISDSNRLNNLRLIDSQSLSFDSAPELSLPERIMLIANSDTEIMALNSGNAMTEDSARSRAVVELSRFIGEGPFEFSFRSCVVEESSAAFAIDTENPTVNMIIWELTLTDADENTAMVTLDDETGMIVKIIFRQGSMSQISSVTNLMPYELMENRLRANAVRMTELMAEYYDLPIILGDHDFNGVLSYYRGDFMYDGMVISMFGVIRPTGFTMNERTSVS